jgi:prepilin-type N-terminal cleavage/methylation domain-containing protein
MIKSRGFTLVEVLIAATILFSSLAVISETYRASLMASQRAESTAKLLTPLPLIVGFVRNKLRETTVERLTGTGVVLGVEFEYEAISERFVSPPPRFDPDLGEFLRYSPRFRLYGVRLTLRYGAQQRQFSYRELAWSPVG